MDVPHRCIETRDRDELLEALAPVAGDVSMSPEGPTFRASCEIFHLPRLGLFSIDVGEARVRQAPPRAFYSLTVAWSGSFETREAGRVERYGPGRSHRLGVDDLRGLRVAVQGVGNVGLRVARHLRQSGAELFVSDIYPQAVAQTVDELGATAVAAKLRRTMREHGISVPRGKGRETRRHAAGLTARQAEVLRLLAEELTNTEIADRLFVSPRTVDRDWALARAWLYREMTRRC